MYCISKINLFQKLKIQQKKVLNHYSLYQIKRINNGSKKSNKWKVGVEFNGITEDGKIVVSGLSVFKFIESKGVPLDFILSSLDKNEYSIDWLDFIFTSVEHKWKLKGTLIKIENSLNDVYGREFSLPIIERLNQICEKHLDYF